MMSRVGHMLARNEWGYYVSTLGPDIGQLMFHKHESGNVIHEFQFRNARNLPTVDTNGIPSAFIQKYTRGKAIVEENKD